MFLKKHNNFIFLATSIIIFLSVVGNAAQARELPNFGECEISSHVDSISSKTFKTETHIITITGVGFGDRQHNNGLNDDTLERIILIGDNGGYLYVSGGQNIISWTDTSITFPVPGMVNQNCNTQDAPNCYSYFEGENRIGFTSGYIALQLFGLGDNSIYICSNPDVKTHNWSLANACVEDKWDCGDWSACSKEGAQTRSCIKTIDCPNSNTPSPISQNCTYTPPTCTSWTYSDWSTCSTGEQQTRTIASSLPEGCAGGGPTLTRPCIACTDSDYSCSNWGLCSSDGTQTRTCTKSSSIDCAGGIPVLTQNCNYAPFCTIEDYSCGNWSVCSQKGKQTRACDKIKNCQDGAVSVATTQSCNYAPACILFYYSNWSECSQDGKQTRNITYRYPTNCEGGETPKATQSCTYVTPCYSDTWSCGNWTTCSSNGSQTRICNKTNDCPTAYTPSPATQQNCAPPCTADTWTCDSWGACSLSGIQSRNCSKTFDCPSAQTAPPITDQFCETPNKPQQTAPSESEEIINQDTIVKATVKLLCPVDERQASQGSGTVIDSAGTILTNKHVIAGTLGCLVGFIDNFSDEPYFGDRQIADIVKVSSNQDIAVLKIRNPKNKALPYVNTTNGNVNFALGAKITTYGYPAKFGTKITYTSGDFSGNDGGFFKTTAILEYGNSGGGAYLKNGTYIGIPTAVVRGQLNAMGYILSINTIRAWLNNSSVAFGNTNNNYSRVSVLEDIDLKKLGSLKLFIPNVDKNSNLVTPATNQDTQKTTDQTQVAPQQESVVIESNNLNKDNTSSSTQNVSSTPEQPPKISLIKRFFLWLSNLFSKLATK